MKIPITEPTLSIDEFNNPKVIKNERAVMLLITRLVLLNKGTIQSHPDMGVGLVARYRYSDQDQARALQADIVQQIAQYLPQFQGAEVRVEYEDHMFYISVILREQAFMMLYDTQQEDPTKAVQTRYIDISDL